MGAKRLKEAANCWPLVTVESAPVSITVAAGTLVTPQHVVLERHFPIPNGTILLFTDRNGNAVARRLVRQDFA